MNIMTTREEHERYCTGPRLEVEEWGRYGDIRRCEHECLMLGYEVLGTIPPYWRTLHPIWTPILYLRARAAERKS